MRMSRTFKAAHYDASLDVSVRLADCLPPDDLARFVVDTIAHLDLSAIYARYGARGGQPYAPEILLGLLFYGYATGLFSSIKMERATYESVPFRFIALKLHPDHDTLATFRKTFLAELKHLFAQVLVLAQLAGVLKLGNLSLDRTKSKADAKKSKAVSYKHLLALEAQLRAEVEELFALSESLDQRALPSGLLVADEIAIRQARLARLAEAKTVLSARAKERDAIEQAEYASKVREGEEKAQRTGRKERGRAPRPPRPAPREKHQYNFTDPDSRSMKHSTDQGFEQHYNLQVALDQASLLIVGWSLSSHATDRHELEATLEAIPSQIGPVAAGALDKGYCSEATSAAGERRAIDASIASGRDAHQPSWQERFAALGAPRGEQASPSEKIA